MFRSIKIISINLFIFLILVVFIELFFGYWFDKNNLGPYVREHRLRKTNYTTTFENKEYNFTYERNYYGIRGKDFPPEKIEIIMVGGSTTDERYKPIEFTIAELIGSELKKDNKNIKIFNLGIEGQSTNGHFINIDYWFKKIPKFKPKYIIYYIGINDQYIEDINYNKFNDGNILNIDKKTAFYDNFKSRSITYDLLRKTKHKFIKPKLSFTYDFDKSINDPKNKNIEFLDYDQFAKNLNEDLLQKHKKLVDQYITRVQKLYDKTTEFGSTPIFINQLTAEGYFNKKLASLNTALIDYCNLQKYFCIDVSKKLKGKKEFWWDVIHTTPRGSLEIAKIIAPELKKILDLTD